VASKFWVDHNEVEENASDNREDIVNTTRKPGRPPKGVGKSKKTARANPSKSCNESFLFFFLNAGGPTNQKTVEILFNILKKHNPLLLFIVETHCALH